jgi:hypothetical protein
MRSAYRIPVAFGLLALSCLAGAQASIQCKTKDGALKERDTANCLQHETRVDPVALGLQGPPGPRGPRGPQGPQGAQGLPGPVAGLHAETRISTFPIDYTQAGGHVFKASCLPGEVVLGVSGTFSVGLLDTTRLAAVYDFDGSVWSVTEYWPDIPAPNVFPHPPLDPVEIDLVCLSLQP